MYAAIHPLIPSVGEGLNRIPLRRPRFTASEAVILNALVNADGKPVTAAELARTIGVMRTSVGQYIVSIRAKLGEPAYSPQLIITDYPSNDNNYQLGWKFVG